MGNKGHNLLIFTLIVLLVILGIVIGIIMTGEGGISGQATNEGNSYKSPKESQKEIDDIYDSFYSCLLECPNIKGILTEGCLDLCGDSTEKEYEKYMSENPAIADNPRLMDTYRSQESKMKWECILITCLIDDMSDNLNYECVQVCLD